MFRLAKSFFNRSFLRVVTGAVLLLFLVYFIRNEHIDFIEVKHVLSDADPWWLALGVMTTAIYLLLQAWLYVYSFESIGISIGLTSALRLFLKRNFISTFLPAGMFTSLAFFSEELNAYRPKKEQVHYGSFLFTMASLISMVVVVVPALYILFSKKLVDQSMLTSMTLPLIIITLLGYISYGFINQSGIAFRLAQRFAPAFISQLTTLIQHPFYPAKFFKACLISLAIEVTGIIHLFIAMKALGLHTSLEPALMGYVVMVVILSLSLFLRGVGIIEVSMVYVFTLYGYPQVQAVSVMLLFRLFEFWLPFIVSGSAFVLQGGNLLLRLLPAFFVFMLGFVNIISALTPVITERLRLLHDFIPLYITEVSNVAVLLMGILLVVLSAFLLTGARRAWLAVLGISALSLIGHVTKALDYEEALVALLCIGILWYTRKAYFAKHNFSFRDSILQKVMVLLIALFLYGSAGFYLLKSHHLDFDFDLADSMIASMKSMVFVNGNFTQTSKAGSYFLYSLQVITACTYAFAFYLAFIRERTDRTIDNGLEKMEAEKILQRCGRSSMDHFKVSSDKQFFFNDTHDAFIAYSEFNHYALALEAPVACNEESAIQIIGEFEKNCARRGLRSYYYRITEDQLPLFNKFRKKHILLGQEAIVDIQNFSLEGASRKSLRNASRKIESSGFRFVVKKPPHSDKMLQQLESVSNQWLTEGGHGESGFSQGVFSIAELCSQTILTVENDQSGIIAFTNIIQSYKAGEATYDLIRKTKDAPNGVLDYLFIKMVEYFKSNDFSTINMGLAPLSGLDGSSGNETIIRFYRDHFKRAAGFKGLYEYKNKFGPTWENRYLIYDESFDLIRFPQILRGVSHFKGSKDLRNENDEF